MRLFKEVVLKLIYIFFTVWSQPGVVEPPPDDSDIEDYDYEYEENANVSDV